MTTIRNIAREIGEYLFGTETARFYEELRRFYALRTSDAQVRDGVTNRLEFEEGLLTKLGKVAPTVFSTGCIAHVLLNEGSLTGFFCIEGYRFCGTIITETLKHKRRRQQEQIESYHRITGNNRRTTREVDYVWNNHLLPKERLERKK